MMATRIPEAYIEEVRNKTNIVDVVSQTVQLHKQGKNLFGLCPFHEERTPSFSVNEEKQIFNCFSCHRGGNVFKFLMELEQISFPEAVIKVAQFSGIPLPEAVAQSRDSVQNSLNSQLQGLYTQAQVLYTHILLKTKVGEPALAYLQNRELAAEVIDEFSLGFAPNQGNVLLDYFTSHQVARELLVRSGLFVQTNDGRLIDRFRNRVMFPITNQNGQVIAFSGRILTASENEPKYLNSPETKLFQKRETLYHFSQAKQSIRESKTAILFEGFMDVISAYKAGVTNGVASMGTSLTSQQLYLLSRAAQKLIVCYDGDEPGQKATAEALKLLKNESFEVGIISLPDKQDPDEFVKAHGAAAFQKQLSQNVLTPIAFQLQHLRSDYNLNLDGDRLAYVQAALQDIVTIDSSVEQELYLQQVANETQLDLTALKNEFETARVKYAQKQRATQRQQQQTQNEDREVPTPALNVKLDRAAISERRLLHLAIHQENVLLQLTSDEQFQFNEPQIQKLFTSWVAYLRQEGSHSIAGFTDQLSSDEVSLLMGIEMLDLPDEVSDEEVADYRRNINQAQLQAQLRQAQLKVKNASNIGDDQAAAQWFSEMLNLKRQLTNS